MVFNSTNLTVQGKFTQTTGPEFYPPSVDARCDYDASGMSEVAQHSEGR